MQHAEYYEVKEDAYLYPCVSKRAGNYEHPEEPVRQWCAYELIRSYAIAITSMEFEREVKVGSKTYRIDILVSRRGQPSVVIECKPRGFKKHDEAMAQAVSYADARGMRAEFAVYTNGEEWRVKRRIQERWEPIPDLPRLLDVHGDMPITFLLGTIHELAAILYKLDEPVYGEEAERFLSALQRFFYGSNLLTEQINRELGFATDNLLRSLCRFFDTHYCWGKIGAACSSFNAYQKGIGSPFEIDQPSGERSLSQEFRHLSVSLLQLTERGLDPLSPDSLILRLNIALLQYGQEQCRSKGGYPPIDQAVHDALRKYLDFALLHRFNAVLPDKLDDIWTGDMRSYCKAIWDTFDAEGRMPFRYIVLAWVRYVLAFIRPHRKCSR